MQKVQGKWRKHLHQPCDLARLQKWEEAIDSNIIHKSAFDMSLHRMTVEQSNNVCIIIAL